MIYYSFSSTKGKILILIFALLAIIPEASAPLRAQQCFPNDPNGTNPGTLCFTLPLTIFPNTMIQTGYARSAFYGAAISPNQPGTSLINQPIKGEFFTSVSATQGIGIKIETNSGRNWTIQETVEKSQTISP